MREALVYAERCLSLSKTTLLSDVAIPAFPSQVQALAHNAYSGNGSPREFIEETVKTILVCVLLLSASASAQGNLRFDERDFTEAELKGVMTALCASRVIPKEQTCTAKPNIHDGTISLNKALEGSFSAANKRELVVQVTYDPPDNRFGGVALFERTSSGLRLMHYTDQTYASDCIKYRLAGRDNLVCYSSGMGQGYVVEILRQVRFTAKDTQVVVEILNVTDNAGTCQEEYTGVSIVGLERRGLNLVVRLEERRGKNKVSCDLKPETLPATRHTLTFTMQNSTFKPDATSARIIAALKR